MKLCMQCPQVVSACKLIFMAYGSYSKNGTHRESTERKKLCGECLNRAAWFGAHLIKSFDADLSSECEPMWICISAVQKSGTHTAMNNLKSVRSAVSKRGEFLLYIYLLFWSRYFLHVYMKKTHDVGVGNWSVKVHLLVSHSALSHAACLALIDICRPRAPCDLFSFFLSSFPLPCTSTLKFLFVL